VRIYWKRKRSEMHRHEDDEIPECIGNFGKYGLECELCQWAGDCLEFQAKVEKRNE